MSSTERVDSATGAAVSNLESLSPIEAANNRVTVSSYDGFCYEDAIERKDSPLEWAEEDDLVHFFPNAMHHTSWCSLGKRKHRQLLVSGYTRALCLLSSTIGVRDVSALVLKFYDLVKYWDFNSKEKVDSLFNSNYRDVLHGPRFTFNDLVLQCTLCPTGWSHRDCVQFYVEFDKKAMQNRLPPHVHSVTAYLVIYCDQIQYEYRTPKTFASIQSAQGWPATRVEDLRDHDFESLNFGCYIELLRVDTKRPLTNYGTDLTTLSPINANRDQISVNALNSNAVNTGTLNGVNALNTVNTLNAVNTVPVPSPPPHSGEDLVAVAGSLGMEGLFPVTTDPLDSIRKLHRVSDSSTRSNDPFGYEQFIDTQHEMAPYSRSEWIVKGELLERFKTAKYSQGFYSPNFDNGSWCLSCSPCGIKREYDGEFCMALKLLRLPYSDRAVKAHHSISIRSDDGEMDIDFSDEKTFDYHRKASRFNLTRSDEWSIRNAKWLRISVEVHVTERF